MQFDSNLPSHLREVDVEKNLATFLRDRDPTDRNASFDYCFNHFQLHREEGRLEALAEGPGLQLSCLHLGFYLASWGMLRASTTLFRKSVRYLVPVVERIVDTPRTVWEIDANGYSDDSCRSLLETGDRIRAAFPGEIASDNRVTKIMLGVFGCVPAFDSYFVKGLGVSRYNLRALHRIRLFYEYKAEEIERHRETTLDFDTGNHTDRSYTRAKIIDMVIFEEGSREMPKGPAGSE